MDNQTKIYPETLDYPPEFEKILESLPLSPGVYVFRDRKGTALYVGKSTKLRKRVQSYFRASSRDRKSRHLRALTKSIDIFCLNSDFQAKEVEADLIRSYRPHYNTLYLDYIRRPMIRISTDEPYASVNIVSNQDHGDSALYYGPYHSNRRIRQIMAILGEIFSFRTCDYQIPAEGDPDRLELCHQHLLGRCEGPCVGNDSPADYQRRVNLLKSFLRGEDQKVINYLEQNMRDHARNREYEAAALVRDQLESLKQMKEYQPFIRETQEADIIYMDQTKAYSMIRIREHRVHEFCIDSPIDTVPDSPHRKITNHPAMIEGLPPQNPEEEKLLEALKQTTRQQRGQPQNFGKIRDRINFHDQTVRRRIDNGSMHEFQLHGPCESQENWIAQHYSVQANRGIPLPDVIENPAGQRIQLPLNKIKKQLSLNKGGTVGSNQVSDSIR